MGTQDNPSLPSIARPITDNRTVWRDRWQMMGQPWRSEPEIDEERQKYLDERRAIVPDIEKGIYPFKDIKLGRADVEWLLATHEGGRGPVNWNDESQRFRYGIDIRGADLRQADLSFLPLSLTRGSLTWRERNRATLDLRVLAAVHMEGANLNRAHLEHAHLHDVHLEDANLRRASLEDANLRGACLDRTLLSFAHLKGASLRGASLKLTNLRDAFLEGARLEEIVFSDEQGVGPFVADAHWDDVNLAVVKWSQISLLGDEYEALQKTRNGKAKEKTTRLDEYERAVRANRQLSVALQAQGLNEIATRFAYRAQKLQRVVIRFQHKYIQYLFSLLLDLLAGYGYRPIRTLLWYVLVVGGFAAAYALSGHLSALPDALVYSLTSFHGRGFFPGLGSETTLHNPLVVLAAAEAVVGLFIEISFIATFTQRYFGK